MDKDLNVVGAPAVVGDKSSQETRMVITLSDPLAYGGTDDAEIMGETVDLSANTSLEDTIASINTAMAANGLDVFASNDGSDPANLLLRSLSGADIVVNDGATGNLFDLQLLMARVQQLMPQQTYLQQLQKQHLMIAVRLQVSLNLHLHKFFQFTQLHQLVMLVLGMLVCLSTHQVLQASTNSLMAIF